MKYGQETPQNAYGRLMTINKRRFVDYSLMTFFVCVSGVPFLSGPNLNVLLFVALAFTFWRRKKNINAAFIVMLALLLLITFLQSLKFDFFPLVTTIGLFTLVGISYFMVKVLQEKFVDYFVTVMYYIAIVSLVFFIPFFLLPSLERVFIYNIAPLFRPLDIAHSGHVTILVYNFSHIGRNCGPFWEPGAFAGYLLLAFMLNFVKEQYKYTKKNIFIFLALFTTFSTTGFLALFTFLFSVYYKKFKYIFVKVFVAISLIALGTYAYFAFDFLGQKIEEQIARETSKQEFYNTRDTGRFLTILRDLKDLEGHEWVGRGSNVATRFGKTFKSYVLRSVGLTDAIVKFGIPFFFFMYFLLSKSMCNYVSYASARQRNKLICTSIIVSLTMLLFSEIYFNYPIFWSLLFLMFAYTSSSKVKSVGSYDVHRNPSL